MISPFSTSAVIASGMYRGVRVPLGPLTVTDVAVDLDVHTGREWRWVSYRFVDIFHAPPYQTKARTSPPTFSLRACLSVITPFEVEMMAMPRPFMTFGHILTVGVDAKAGLGNAAQPGDNRAPCLEPYFSVDADDALLAVVDDLKALDIALVHAESGRSPFSCWKRECPPSRALPSSRCGCGSAYRQ